MFACQPPRDVVWNVSEDSQRPWTIMGNFPNGSYGYLVGRHMGPQRLGELFIDYL